MRILYRLDRYSEDLDFSLPQARWLLLPGRLWRSTVPGVRQFRLRGEFRKQTAESANRHRIGIPEDQHSAQFIVVKAPTALTGALHPGEQLKIRLEVDTDPPGGFETESRAVLLPIPFAVRTYSLPDLFAGKMHALLCRKWKQRVKGRDWYDLVWYLAHHPQLRLRHLESRLRSSGDWSGPVSLTRSDLLARLQETITRVDLEQIKQETDRFVDNKSSLAPWSREFFLQIMDRIEVI